MEVIHIGLRPIVTVPTSYLTGSDGEYTVEIGGYTVSYNANGGTGTMESHSTTTGSITLKANQFTREGYTFKGWGTSLNTDTVVYVDKQIISIPKDITLYAVWGMNNNDGTT